MTAHGIRHEPTPISCCEIAINGLTFICAHGAGSSIAARYLTVGSDARLPPTTETQRSCRLPRQLLRVSDSSRHVSNWQAPQVELQSDTFRRAERERWPPPDAKSATPVERSHTSLP